MNKFLPY